jgi:hypothetical protein
MSKTAQPAYHCIANLGDMSPLTEGGCFVLVDRRGIYDPQVWDWDPDGRKLHRYDIPQCFPCTGKPVAIGHNRFHPHLAEWFGDAKSLHSVADTHGVALLELRTMLMHSDPLQRAEGYRMVARNFGRENFDNCPETLTPKEAKLLINRLLRQCAAADGWKDGLA